jgi:hypothetical protein
MDSFVDFTLTIFTNTVSEDEGVDSIPVGEENGGSGGSGAYCVIA